MKPMTMVTTMPQARTFGGSHVSGGHGGGARGWPLTKVIFCHSCQLSKKTPLSLAPKPMVAVRDFECLLGGGGAKVRIIKAAGGICTGD